MYHPPLFFCSILSWVVCTPGVSFFKEEKKGALPRGANISKKKRMHIFTNVCKGAYSTPSPTLHRRPDTDLQDDHSTYAHHTNAHQQLAVPPQTLPPTTLPSVKDGEIISTFTSYSHGGIYQREPTVCFCTTIGTQPANCAPTPS